MKKVLLYQSIVWMGVCNIDGRVWQKSFLQSNTDLYFSKIERLYWYYANIRIIVKTDFVDAQIFQSFQGFQGWGFRRLVMPPH